MEIVPFGRWPSPISAEMVAEGALRFGRLQVNENAVYWSEGRPAEQGRTPVLRWTEKDGITELLPPPYSARSRVHEYGGGEFLIAAGKVYFVNDADQDVYERELAPQEQQSLIRRLTQVSGTRFADFTFDARRKRLICVGESHNESQGRLPQNALWMVPAGTGLEKFEPHPLLTGHDFYASPRLSADGNRLAFLAWNLPHMPWDAAELFVADVAADGSLTEPIAVAGGDASACFQPEWGADGALYFVWDREGTGNLFRWQDGRIEQITHLDADLSMPLWNFHAASYALLPDRKAYLAFVKMGETGSAILDLDSGQMEARNNGLTAAFAVAAGQELVALSGMSDNDPLTILADALRQPFTSPAAIRRSSSVAIDSAYVPKPGAIDIPTERGTIYGLFYEAKNPAVIGPPGQRPPLIISLHGGPTSAATRGLKPRVLFFTSRGYHWLDLNYSGSVGYGRYYRDRLNGNWGVADVEDTIDAARFVASAGLADPQSIFVTGGSAGGYTVLMTIARSSIFRGAASYYGICDLVALQRTTHKFELGYESALLGVSVEEDEARYRERSAISHIAQMNTPLILFQGVEDNVVPKAQSIMIADALSAKGVRVEYHEFAGEGHGFRKRETISACLTREAAFYQSLLEERG